MVSYTINQQSSASLSLIETQIRNRLLMINRSTSAYSSKSLPELRTLFDSTTTADIIMSTYVNAKQYEALDTVQNEMMSGSGRNDQQLATQAAHAYRYTSTISYQPLIDQYIHMLKNANGVLQAYSILERTDERVHDAIGDLLSCLLDYCQASVDQYEIYRFDDEHQMSKRLDQDCMDFRSATSMVFNFHVNATTLYDEFKTSSERLKDQSTYPEVVKFILSRDIGSYAIAYIPDLSSPLLLSLVPTDADNDTIDPIWKARFDLATSDEIDATAKPISDYESEKLARSMLNSLSTASLHAHKDHVIKRSVHKKSSGISPEDESAASFGMSFTHTPKAKIPKGKGRQKDNRKGDESPRPSGSNQGSQQPQVPDDTSYEPDALFARLARDITSFVRILPHDDMTNDHMTRFSSTTESSQAISRDSLRNTDQRIVTRDRYGSRTYLVTFTRRSRKPIFNPVS